MARRLVSGAKEATAGLRIARKAYRKTGPGAAIKSQNQRAEVVTCGQFSHWAAGRAFHELLSQAHGPVEVVSRDAEFDRDPGFGVGHLRASNTSYTSRRGGIPE